MKIAYRIGVTDWRMGNRMDAKFTPGPWSVTDADVCPVIRDAANGLVAGISMRRDLKAVDANASLIAAAPELYGACRAALNMVDTDQGPPNWDMLRAALAKAEGR